MSAVTPPLPPAAELPPHAQPPAAPGAHNAEARARASAWLRAWWPLCLGFALLVGTTSWRFGLNLWQLPEFEHGPLLLAVALWMLWHQRSAIIEAKAPRSAAGAFALLAFSLLLYLLGVRLKAGYIEFGALAPALAACLAMLGGWRLVPRFSYVLLFLVLATPMPAPVIFAATSGLKLWVSQVAEFVLHAAGYPVGRDGVTLRVGQYGLLMADACSGMNSLISLLATGFLYIYLTARRTVVHTALLIAAILPVAVATNIVRVIILMLITYHLGDEAGQGFLHEFAGFVMFLVAVLILAGLDIAFGRVLALGRRGAAGGSST